LKPEVGTDILSETSVNHDQHTLLKILDERRSQLKRGGILIPRNNLSLARRIHIYMHIYIYVYIYLYRVCITCVAHKLVASHCCKVCNFSLKNNTFY